MKQVTSLALPPTSYTPSSVPATLTSSLVLKFTVVQPWAFTLAIFPAQNTLSPGHGSFWASVQMLPHPWPSQPAHLAGLRPLVCFISSFALYYCGPHCIVDQFIVLSLPFRSPMKLTVFVCLVLLGLQHPKIPLVYSRCLIQIYCMNEWEKYNFRQVRVGSRWEWGGHLRAS